jgi:hypothetical protein
LLNAHPFVVADTGRDASPDGFFEAKRDSFGAEDHAR